jgi:hypothetical protein
MKIEFTLVKNIDYWLKLFPEENTVYPYSTEICFRVGQVLTIMEAAR